MTEIIVEWKTASEFDTAGFNIFRSDELNGSYKKINQGLIPASSDPLTGSDYLYEDRNVLPGKIYFYQLEDISMAGNATRFGPIEVKARRGGIIEIVISCALLSIGLSGIVYFRRSIHLSQGSPNDK